MLGSASTNEPVLVQQVFSNDGSTFSVVDRLVDVGEQMEKQENDVVHAVRGLISAPESN